MSTTKPYRPTVLFVMPPCLPTPPKGYGGIEAVAQALIPALENAGAKLILCTPIGSTISATERHLLTAPLFPIFKHPYPDVAPAIQAYIARVLKLARRPDIDLIHDFSGLGAVLNNLAAPLSNPSYPPVIHTIHNPVSLYGEVYTELAAQHSRLTFVGVSKAQLTQASLPVRRSARVIYNGLNLDDYPTGKSGERLLVMGRICHDKGQDRLVEYCAQHHLDLDVAGTVAEMSTPEEINAACIDPEHPAATSPDLSYYRRFRHYFDDQHIVFHGNVGGAHKRHLLGDSRALVMPNRWAEPFGMVAIEAMASGTPVVAMKNGALPELIVHGVTGYLAETFEELCKYLSPRYLDRIDRTRCRQHVAMYFSANMIAKQWASLYQNLIKQSATYSSQSFISSPLSTGIFNTRYSKTDR